MSSGFLSYVNQNQMPSCGCTLEQGRFCVEQCAEHTLFNDTFMVFTFNISSLLHSCRIKPLQRKAHNRSESIACVYEIQDLLLFILREKKVGFIY